MSNNAPARSGLAAEIIARNAREGNNQMISEEATFQVPEPTAVGRMG